MGRFHYVSVVAAAFLMSFVGCSESLDPLETTDSSPGAQLDVEMPGDEPQSVNPIATFGGRGTRNPSSYGVLEPDGNNSLTVTFPNGGEYFCRAQYAVLMWKFTGRAVGDYVRIELKHDGETCLTIEENAPNTGSYVWYEILQCGDESHGYTVRVTDLGSGATDESDAFFVITACPE